MRGSDLQREQCVRVTAAVRTYKCTATAAVALGNVRVAHGGRQACVAAGRPPLRQAQHRDEPCCCSGWGWSSVEVDTTTLSFLLLPRPALREALSYSSGNPAGDRPANAGGGFLPGYRTEVWHFTVHGFHHHGEGRRRD